MSFFSALRRKPEEEDLYEDYEESYAYEDEGQDWASEGVQPIHSSCRYADRLGGSPGVQGCIQDR